MKNCKSDLWIKNRKKMFSRIISLSACGVAAFYLADGECLSAIVKYVITHSTMEYFLSGIGEFEREVDRWYVERGRFD